MELIGLPLVVTKIVYASASDVTIWTATADTIFSGGNGGEDVQWNGSYWLAVGAGTATAARSTDSTTWTTFSIFSTAGYGIGWNGTMWMAVGDDTTNTIKYSYDATTWLGLGKTIFTTRGMNICWNGSMWIAGGTGGNRIAYSYDGFKWIPLGNSIFTAQVEAIGFDNPQTNIPLATSTTLEANNWTGTCTSIFNTGSTKSFWGGNSLIALGTGNANSIAYSTNNGLNWTGCGSSLIQAPNSICWNGNIKRNSIEFSKYTIVAVGQGTNSIAFSNDGGVSFEGLGSTIFTSGYTVSVYNNYWLAGGTGTYSMAYSNNSRDWFPILNSASIFSAVYGIIKSNNIYIVVGEGSATTIAYSYDGKSFMIPFTPLFTTAAYDIDFNGKLHVAVGSGASGTLASSVNGISNWTFNSDIFDVSGKAVLWDSYNTKWYALGEGSVTTIAYSYNGLSWNSYGKTIFTVSGNDIDANNVITVAVGSGTNSIATFNGTTWIGRGTSIFNVGNSVKWNKTLWLALGSGGGSATAAYSITGIVWIPCVNSLSIFSTSGNGSVSNYRNNSGVVIREHPIILLGNGVDNTMAYSTNNGMSFTGLGTTIFSFSGNRGIYNGSIYIALGTGNTNTVAISYSGLDWVGLGTTIFSTSGRDICFFKNKFIATGEGLNTFAYSYDGVYWTGSGINTFLYGTAISNNDTLIVSCGIGDYDNMAFSNDAGITWSGMGYTIFDTSANGIANDGRNWVCAGQGSVNTMAFSNDGVTWDGLGTTIFNNYGSSVSWNGSLFMAVGSSSTAKIASSPNGLVWTLITSSLSFGNDVAWCGDNAWIVSGNFTLYSYNNGTTWTVTQTNDLFSISSNGIISNVKNCYKFNTQINIETQLDISSNTFSDGFQNFSLKI